MALFSCIIGATAVMADSPIAKAVSVRPQAESLLGSAQKIVLNDEDLFEGQRITTGQYGQVQILFADQTKMVVGPSSSLVIEKILMRNNGTASSFAVTALGGTYRFLTGNSAKNAYKITTPTGTIGVRGTEFDFVVDRVTGETKVILFNGAAIVCANSSECVTLTEICGLATTSTGGSDAELLEGGNDSRSLRNDGFKYVNNQNRLLRSFRVDDDSACGQAIQNAFPVYESLSSPVSSPPAPAPVTEPEPEEIPDLPHCGEGGSEGGGYL